MPVFTNVFEIVMKSTLIETSFTKNLANVFHFRLLSGTPDTPTNILTAFQLSIGLAYQVNILTTDGTHVENDGRWMDDATNQYTVQSIGSAGLIALPRLPGDLAIVFPYTGSQRGKSYRGSKHITPIASAYVTKDELNATGLTAAGVLQGQMAGNLTTTNGSVMKPIVFSRSLSQTRTNPTTLVGSDVSSILINKTIGTMRRRKEKTVR